MRRLLTAISLVLTFTPLDLRGEVPYEPGKEPVNPARLVAEKIAAKHTLQNFYPSLEAREATDFLVYPALLVQNLKINEPVQFDAVIRLKRQISRSDVTLFARYSISSNAYSVGVVWAEPHGRFLEYAAYPPSLRIVSTETEFRIDHSVFTNCVGAFAKPILTPSVFTNQFGDYPITQLRFAEARMANSPWLRAPRTNGQANIQRGMIQETPVKLGLAGEGARIGLGGTNYDIREIAGIDLRGGRTYGIRWSSGDEIPQYFAIGLPNGTMLYEATLSNFQKTAEDVDRFARFSNDDLSYRVLLDRYWKKAPGEVTRPDQTEANRLIQQYASCGSQQESAGEKLKRLNILMELNRMIGDEEAHVGYFRKYLNELKSQRMESLILIGGQTAVDTLMIWKRTREAKRLMDLWVEHATDVDQELLVAFVERELEKGNFVTTLFLLDAAQRSVRGKDNERLAGLRTKAVRKFAELASDRELCETSEIVAGQVALAKQSFEPEMMGQFDRSK